MHKTWDESVARGEWLGRLAGGCANHATYLNNPQFIFTVHDDGEVMLALMQKNKTCHFREGRINHSIGFQVLKVEENRNHRITKGAQQVVAAKATYINAREVFIRCDLLEGRYIVVPTTFDPDKESSFMLRLVS